MYSEKPVESGGRWHFPCPEHQWRRVASDMWAGMICYQCTTCNEWWNREMSPLPRTIID
jgi:hypothetical protein